MIGEKFDLGDGPVSDITASIMNEAEKQNNNNINAFMQANKVKRYFLEYLP